MSEEIEDLETETEELDYSQNADAMHGLTEREKIRTKMGMYAGGNDNNALKVLVREPNDNAIDEWNYVNSHKGENSFDTVEINIDTKNILCSVRDYGRGIPYVKDKNGVSVLEKAVSILHMGGKHDNTSKHLVSENIDKSKDNYSFSAGINGVGITLTNYASELFYAVVYNEKNKEKSYVAYRNGYLEKSETIPLDQELILFDENINSSTFNKETLNSNTKTGTLIAFKPSIKEDAFDDEGVFDEGVNFDYELIYNQLQTLPYLNPGLKIVLHFDDKKIVFEKQKQFMDIVEHKAKDRKYSLIFDTVHFKEHMIFAKNLETKTTKVYSLEEFIKLSYEQRKILKPIESVFELAFNFVEGAAKPFQENNVNGSIIISGGKQDAALKSKMKGYINDYIGENFKNIGTFETEDIMSSLSFMFQVKINDPKFGGQTKDKLENTELLSFGNFFFKKYLKHWINREDKTKMSRLIKMLEANRKARIDSAKTKENAFKEILNKSDDALLANTAKLTKCKSKNPELCELFLVEGDSASGPCKNSRVPEYQAILPLKGKLLNALKEKNISNLMKNQEIINLITAMECGIGENYDYSKLRFHKIVILTDKDDDGLHIRNLDYVFFYKYFPDLIEKGHIYIVDSPLYAIKTSKETHFAWSLEERDAITSGIKSKYEITRFKGLGEMNDEQLYETCLNKSKRKIIQATLDDFEGIDVIEEDADYSNEELENLIHVYMGDSKEDLEAREILIEEYYSEPKTNIIKLETPPE